jgi:hypothetical protein
MNTQVSFELAKLLKERGFNEEVRDYHEEKDGTFYRSQYFRDKISINEKHKGFVVVPTIAEVVMWLYEKHGIWIEVHRWTNQPVDDEIWEECFQAFTNGDAMDVATFKSPTEAYEAAIRYCLEKII